jgi:hypothetical protein
VKTDIPPSEKMQQETEKGKTSKKVNCTTQRQKTSASHVFNTTQVFCEFFDGAQSYGNCHFELRRLKFHIQKIKKRKAVFVTVSAIL